VIGWVDAKNEQVHGLKIPGGLSLLTYRDFETPIAGLDQVPRENWPNVPLVFQTYHIMIMMWAMMVLIALLGFWYWKRGTLQNHRWFLWVMIFSVLLPHIAQQAGWASAEIGRQPWIVWGLLKTSDGVSSAIRSAQVVGSLTMFTVIYALLFFLFLFLLDRKIKQGPESILDESMYRNLL
jgi:cytochrome d ubiquinol oxidase subunit I